MTNSLNLPTNPSHNDTYSTFGVTYTYDSVNDVWLANRPPTIDDMVDVDTTTIAPTANQVLSWDVNTNNFIPTDGFDARLSASTIDWSAVQNTPTTIASYGITDAYTIAQVDNAINTIELTPGPQGATGPAGADGADGATGPQGPAGSSGGGTTYGAVGTYAFLRSTSNSVTISPNTDYSGSSLNYTSIHRSTGNNILMPTNGGQPVGTWRSMGGGTDNVFGGTNWAATLFVRIS